MMSIFSNIVKKEFSFLSNSGFHLSCDVLGKVCFQSDISIICITWDKRSGELEVYIQPSHEVSLDMPYSLRDIISMEEKGLLEARVPFQALEKNQLGLCVKRIADDVREYATKALKGDRMYYRNLSEFRSRQARTFMKEMQLRQARVKAKAAWDAHNYQLVVEQFEMILDDLSSAERKKLKIAKEYINN